MFEHTCRAEDAGRIASWMRERGGIAIWESRYIGDGRSWTTPNLTEDGKPVGKPHSYAGADPDQIIVDPAQVGVVEYEEFKRFHVGVRRGSQGLSLKLTDGATRRLRHWLAKAGEGSTYYFDYMTQDAVVLRPARTVSLVEYMQQVEVA